MASPICAARAPRPLAGARVKIVRLAPHAQFKRRHPHDRIWPFQLLNAAALLRRAGGAAELLDGWVDGRSESAVSEWTLEGVSDVLLISFSSPSLEQAGRLARLYRRRTGGEVWACGQHASARPEEIAGTGAFQGMLVGEVEEPLRAWLGGAWGSGLVPVEDGNRICVDQPAPAILEDLDSLPMPSVDLLSMARYGMESVHCRRYGRSRWGFLLSSRGCPYKCTYCSPVLRQSFGTRYRAQSAERVVEEMEVLSRRYGCGAFYFADDVTTLNRKRIYAMCSEIRRRRLRTHWIVQTRPDLLDRALLREMKSAGCTGVKFGVESGDEGVLDRIQRDIRRERILRAASDVHAEGLDLTAYFMVGHPGETADDVEQTFRVAREVRALMIQVAVHTPYPGSGTAAGLGGGRDGASAYTSYAHYDSVAENVSRIPTQSLKGMVRRFYLRYYFTPASILRYLLRRLPYRLLNGGDLRLGIQALLFMLWGPGEAPRTDPDVAAKIESDPSGNASGHPWPTSY